MTAKITILGAFFVDLACRADRMPIWGETLHGKTFVFGPGGKGTNQAVAAARQGAEIQMITRVGRDPFGDMARTLFTQENIGTDFILTDPDTPTGSATIIVDSASGKNAIIIVPAACSNLSTSDVEAASGAIGNASFFVSQLELALDACRRGIEIAHNSGVPVLLNPAPAIALPDHIYPLISYLTPNESEATTLSGVPVTDIASAKIAGRKLRDLGTRNVIITLGEAGAYISGESVEGVVPAFRAGPVLDTTGAGDAFNGGLVTALSRGATLQEATRFGCAVAGISVTRSGAALSMPTRHEVERLLGTPL